MPNELDETDISTINTAGRDVHVIEKKVAVELDGTDKFMYVFAWCMLIIPGLIFMTNTSKAHNYLQQLQQRINAAASTIDNYQMNRIQILTNTAKLLQKAIDLDQETLTAIAGLRSGMNPNADPDTARNELAERIGKAERALNVAFENYPKLEAHAEIRDAMQQNILTQHEITAARDNYNDMVLRWNTEIFQQWSKKRAAAKAGYTTRIPFTLPAELKAQSQSVFF